jgi:hypothetical protein
MTTTLIIKDGLENTQQLQATVDGNGILTPSQNALLTVSNAPVSQSNPVFVDGSNIVQPVSGTVAVSSLPNTIATSANQTTAITTLTTIATNTTGLATSANQTTELASLASINTATTLGQLSPSGTTAILGSFTSTGNSGYFIPIYGRPLNILIFGTFVATISLYRKTQAGGSYFTNFPITAQGTQLYTYTAPCNERYTEYVNGTTILLVCTSYTSGTASFVINQ